MGERIVGVAKGALGRFVESYLKSMGTDLDIDGPQTQVKDLPGGKVTFRIMRSRDVPRRIGLYDRDFCYDFGITGSDVAEDEVCYSSYALGIRKLRDEAERLGFGNLLGNVSLLAREDYGIKKKRLSVAVSDYYPFLARQKLEDMGFDDFDLVVVRGAVEGYLSSGECELAVDTIFSKNTIGKENLELTRRGKPKIIVLKKLVDAVPAVIYNKSRSFRDFCRLFIAKGD